MASGTETTMDFYILPNATQSTTDSTIRSQQPEVLTRTRRPSSDKPYSCQFCPKTFQLQTRLDNHLKIHIGVGLENCTECGKQFTSAIGLKQHMVSHTGKYMCHCGYSAGSFDNLKSHGRYHVDPGVPCFKCYVCTAFFATEVGLKKHQRIHQKKKYQCQRCSFVTTNRDNLEPHQRLHRAEDARKNVRRTTISDDNSSTSSSSSSSTSTILKNHTERMLPALISVQQHQLQGLAQNQIGEERWKAQIAAGSTTNSPSIIQKTDADTASGGGDNADIFVCVFCDYRTTIEACLIIHTSRHVGSSDNFRCSRCPLTFPTPTSLAYHLDHHPR